MSEQVRICDSKHKPSYRLVHKGNSIFDTLIILCCEDCINKKPFCEERLQKEVLK